MSQLVEKLRQERAERQRKQEEELAKYDAELKVKRDGKLKGKVKEVAATNSLLKTLETSLQKVRVSNETAQYEKTQMAKGLSHKQDMRDFQFDQWDQMKRKDKLKLMDLTLRSASHGNTLRLGRGRPKKFQMNPAEFYDLDFSYSSNNVHQSLMNAAMKSIMERDEELIELFRKREDAMLDDPDAVKNLILHGQKFVKAMRDGIKKQKKPLSRQASTTLAVVSEEDIDPLMKSVISETESEAQNDNVDDFLKSLNDLSEIAKADDYVIQNDPSPLQPQRAATTSRIRDKILKQVEQQQVDYSECFPQNVGQIDGIFVFRIEELKPKLMKKSQVIQKLSTGDCYIVLYVWVNDAHDMDWNIYQWVGQDSSLDKKACSAIYSVGLRGLLSPCASDKDDVGQITRESSGEESQSFLNMFHGQGTDVVIVGKEEAVASGLYKVQEREWPLLCYRVYSKKVSTGQKDSSVKTSGVMKLDLVAPDFELFDSTQVYVVDSGMIVYQWNGAQSSITDRMKAKFFANGIVTLERATIQGVTYESVDQGDEHQAFIMLFQDVVEASEDYDQVEGYKPELYIIPSDIVTTLKKYRQTFTVDSLQVKGVLNRSMLKDDECALLDCTTELYYWIGSKSLPEVRMVAEKYLIQMLYNLKERPSYTISHRLMEGVENEAFKARFAGWNEQLIRRTSFMAQPKDDGKQIELDISAIYVAHPTGRSTRQEDELYEQIINKANKLLVNLQVFAFDDSSRKFVKVPEWTIAHGDDPAGRELSHFWSEDTLVFLCIYNKVNEKEESSDDLHAEAKVQAQECVTYVWTGRDVQSPSLGQLIFAHSFKNQIKELIYEMSRGKMSVRFVNIMQERESLALCSHFGRIQCIHSGKRKVDEEVKHEAVPFDKPAAEGKFQPKNVKLFHIRTDLKYKITRAIEVTPMLQSLCTRDSFFLMYTGADGLDANNKDNSFLWVGKGCSKEEERQAHKAAQKIVQLHTNIKPIPDMPLDSQLPYNIMKEKLETDAFWRLLAPSFTKPVKPQLAMGQGYYYSLPPPRLFKCSTATGQFVVTELSKNSTPYSVSDLTSSASNGEESIYFLDSGPGKGKPYLVYVWIGKRASDVVAKLTKKALDSYLEHWADGRSLNYSEWDTNVKRPAAKQSITGALRMDVILVRQDAEPDEFRAFFHGWGSPYKIDPEAAASLGIEVEEQKKLKFEPTNAFLRGEIQDGELIL